MGNIPFFACSADHPEVISGTADLIVVCKACFSGEQRICSAYVPKWVISAETGQELCICIDFSAVEAYVHLHIEDVSVGCAFSESTKDAPDLTEWLWFLVSEQWKDEEGSESAALERVHAHRNFVRDICNAILDRYRRLGA